MEFTSQFRSPFHYLRSVSLFSTKKEMDERNVGCEAARSCGLETCSCRRKRASNFPPTFRPGAHEPNARHASHALLAEQGTLWLLPSAEKSNSFDAVSASLAPLCAACLSRHTGVFASNGVLSLWRHVLPPHSSKNGSKVLILTLFGALMGLIPHCWANT